MKNYWKIDHEHSELRFEIEYLMISKISGFITSFDASFQTDENGFKNMVQVRLSADVASLNSNNSLRDTHIKGEQYFDAAKYSDILFSSTEFVHGAGELPTTLLSSDRQNFVLSGILTIKGVTKPIVLEGTFGGSTTDPGKRIRAGFTIKAKINRNDFNIGGITYTKAGQLLLGDEVTIIGNCQFIQDIQ